MPSVLGCSSSKYEACAISMGSNEAPSKISVKTIYKQSKGFSISWLKASRKWASDILGWCWDVWQQWKTILQLMFGYLSLTGQGRHVLSPSMEEKTIVGLCRLNRNPFFSRCPFSATYSSPCWAAVVMRATISPCSTASCSERTNTSLSSSSRLSISLMTRWRSSTPGGVDELLRTPYWSWGWPAWTRVPWQQQRSARSLPVQQGLSESLPWRWISAEKRREGGCWKRKQKDGHLL